MNQVHDSSNYYAILGLDPSATEDDIKRAYRKLSLQCHPDKVQGRQEEFEKLVEAYKVLSNPELRPIYDAYGKKHLETYRQMDGYRFIGGFLQWAIRKKTAYQQRAAGSFQPNAAGTSPSSGSRETCRCCAKPSKYGAFCELSRVRSECCGCPDCLNKLKKKTAYQQTAVASFQSNAAGTSSSRGSLETCRCCAKPSKYGAFCQRSRVRIECCGCPDCRDRN
ncbi:dnaJ domain-containing protein [Ditylenchus destructor]|nr:dnaJ domain-containing protein [Ditylenchus destructor]